MNITGYFVLGGIFLVIFGIMYLFLGLFRSTNPRVQKSVGSKKTPIEHMVILLCAIGLFDEGKPSFNHPYPDDLPKNMHKEIMRFLKKYAFLNNGEAKLFIKNSLETFKKGEGRSGSIEIAKGAAVSKLSFYEINALREYVKDLKMLGAKQTQAQKSMLGSLDTTVMVASSFYMEKVTKEGGY